MSKLAVSLISGAFWMAAFAGVANAECTIAEHFNYEGQSGVVQDNDLLRFTDDNRTLVTTHEVREFRDPSWLNKISSVKVTENCRAVFWNENGAQFALGHQLVEGLRWSSSGSRRMPHRHRQRGQTQRPDVWRGVSV